MKEREETKDPYTNLTLRQRCTQPKTACRSGLWSRLLPENLLLSWFRSSSFIEPWGEMGSNRTKLHVRACVLFSRSISHDVHRDPHVQCSAWLDAACRQSWEAVECGFGR